MPHVAAQYSLRPTRTLEIRYPTETQTRRRLTQAHLHELLWGKRQANRFSQEVAREVGELVATHLSNAGGSQTNPASVKRVKARQAAYSCMSNFYKRLDANRFPATFGVRGGPVR